MFDNGRPEILDLPKCQTYYDMIKIEASKLLNEIRVALVDTNADFIILGNRISEGVNQHISVGALRHERQFVSGLIQKIDLEKARVEGVEQG
jgi:hypothetical protein